MNLSFSTQLKGKPTYFVEKILSGLHGLPEFIGFHLTNKYQHNLDLIEYCESKIHAIIKDSNQRWKAGIKIHFVINTRTKNRFQFADGITVVSTQDIWISPSNKSIRFWHKDNKNATNSYKDGYWFEMDNNQIELLSKNEGFDNVEDFWNYFNHEFGGKIIHWTTLSY